jgi:hypothetical protein
MHPEEKLVALSSAVAAFFKAFEEACEEWRTEAGSSEGSTLSVSEARRIHEQESG